MIDTTPTPARPRRRRGRWGVLPTAIVLLTTLAPTTSGSGATPALASEAATSMAGTVAAHWSALVEAAYMPSEEAVHMPKEPVPAGPEESLALPGPVPAKGHGTFGYAPGKGRVLGTAGSIKQFRVAVERDIGEDIAEFADQVEDTLGDPQSWVGGGQVRLRRVSSAGTDRADFTVFLASRESAAKMCLRSGTDIREDGIPYTSCRTPGKVIINLDRWRLSAPTYLDAGIPLAVYRQYVINHEVGHELGHAHQGCPKPGGPAPVMVQQTLTLRGCVPYPWPRIGGRWLSGPPTRH